MTEPFRLDPLPVGLYERLVTDALRDAITAAEADGLIATREDVDAAEIDVVIARHVAAALASRVGALPERERNQSAVDLANTVVELIDASALDRVAAAEQLVAITPPALPGQPGAPPRPAGGLSATALLTNATGEPGVGAEVRAELQSADSVDLIVAFVRWSGLRTIEAELRRFLDSGRRLRVITTTYTGATQRRALDLLARMGAEVKVSYDTRTTRLHAKAWLFLRNTGFHTAYIGSSNLSRAALHDGLEWNIRASAVTSPGIIEKFAATFETYWEDDHFEPYDPDRDAERFDRAVGSARRDAPLDVALLDVRPYAFQQRMLDALEVERERHGRWRNLVIAATGTGKTVVAALDYRRLKASWDRARLLFVAHRKEILDQALRTFRAVLRDGAFGERYVDGHRPDEWDHVFASIQSLTSLDATSIDPAHFDVVIVDEFHHAAADTYRRLLDHVAPRVLLGLTATPERADGQDVREWFGSRYAVELRLWEALEQGLLVPFHYFGVHDDVDLSGLGWSGGRYPTAELDNVYIGDDRRVAKILGTVHDKVADPAAMRALGFCVSIRHAEYMAHRFTQAGIPSQAVSTHTSSEARAAALRKLRDGTVNVVFAVDLFNEGVDVPEVDTVLFLRPTESATVFLQQLGRGLRHAADKPCLTVLDFVGNQHRRFRFDQRFRALLRGTRRDVIAAIEQDFPLLPPGCHVELDRVARDIVLANVRAALPTRWPERVAELRSLGDVGLAEFLAASGLEPDDVYANNRSWTELRRAAGLPTAPLGPEERRLLRAVRRLLHVDDPLRLDHYRRWLRSEHPPRPEGDAQRRLLYMLHLGLSGTSARYPSLDAALANLWAHPAVRAELVELFDVLDARADHLPNPLGLALAVPLAVHARYSRDEVLAAFDQGTPVKPPQLREGVRFDEATQTDLFFVTLDKTDKGFSPTTRYRDYAISPHLFHWESQSTTTAASPTGQRYVHHVRDGTNVLLFAREQKRGLTGAARAYLFLGPATYVRHEGERPMAITWRLRDPMPADFFQEARVAAG